MIAVRGLAHRYGSAEALRLAQWSVAQGERWAVLGASGSGKTTLLHVIAGLVRPTEGEVEVSGEKLRKLDDARLDRWRGATVGIVLQALHLVRHLSVRDNLRLAQYLAHLPQDDLRIDDTLSSLGVGGKASRRPPELSQGERQRVAIARAVVNRPKLLLADEPTANLDDAAAVLAVDLLTEQAARHGATLVVATHDARVKTKFRERLELA
jgi:ABC-type antimicrobial peptide transport system, ATPase component